MSTTPFACATIVGVTAKLTTDVNWAFLFRTGQSPNILGRKGLFLPSLVKIEVSLIGRGNLKCFLKKRFYAPNSRSPLSQSLDFPAALLKIN